jgi:tetraacyldisaccharide 4'-kinase
MKAPSFWYQPPGFLSTFLQPLGWLYGKGGKLLSSLKKQQHFPIPIISVGNIVCGGSGKTPTALALAQLLQARGHKVHFVTRGYGGTQKGPLRVDLTHHSYRDVGDEPLLLADTAPTWVAKERPLGVQKAIENGAQVVILDDGHQTSCLRKDLAFVVVDLMQGYGNRHIIPAGPLREDLSAGLKRTDALIVVGKGEMASSKPFFRAQVRNQPPSFPSNRVVAFCGLGYPMKFYKTLEELGVDLVATHSFPDHYKYRQEDLLELQKLAKTHQAVLITTRKDAVKIPSSWRMGVHVLDIDIHFEDPERVYGFIAEKVFSV